MNVSRRRFLQSVVSVAGVAMWDAPGVVRGDERPSAPNRESVAGAIVICNHWTQYGIGETFPEGEIGGRWYRKNFSTVFGLEQGRRWLELSPLNRVCHELDAYALDSLAAEDPQYLATVRGLLDRNLMELPGGTFGQADSRRAWVYRFRPWEIATFRVRWA